MAGPMAMDEQYFRVVISGRGAGWEARLLRPMLRLAGRPYGGVMSLRRWLYRAGWKRRHQARVPVISVGNITVGGTGKTPLVAWMTRHLLAAGRSPAILIRGYRAVSGLSDEAEMLRRLTGAVVMVRADRVAGAAAAVAGGADVLVMDDGFQHLRLRRDLDVVTVDATCPFGHGAVLPGGLLREPVGALRDAGAVVLTRCDLVDEAVIRDLRRRLADLAPEAVLAETTMQPTALCGFDGWRRPVDDLAGRTAWAFCGLGNPEAFYRTLADRDVHLAGRTTFNDHHAYSADDLHRLHRQAEEAGAPLLVTTAKDAGKLAGLPAAAEVRWLEIEVAFGAGQAALERRVAEALQMTPGR